MQQPGKHILVSGHIGSFVVKESFFGIPLHSTDNLTVVTPLPLLLLLFLVFPSPFVFIFLNHSLKPKLRLLLGTYYQDEGQDGARRPYSQRPGIGLCGGLVEAGQCGYGHCHQDGPVLPLQWRSSCLSSGACDGSIDLYHDSRQDDHERWPHCGGI